MYDLLQEVQYDTKNFERSRPFTKCHLVVLQNCKSHRSSPFPVWQT